mmetsp:Transcript_3411/g.6903  ORF Transcript_3411/g.6903 Transcript_3411/m.6903 type:complete len:99 (+) Transcript_3411:525-821(+)
MIRHGWRFPKHTGLCRRMSQNSSSLCHHSNRFLVLHRTMAHSKMQYSGENRLGGEESPYLSEPLILLPKHHSEYQQPLPSPFYFRASWIKEIFTTLLK